MFSFIYDAGVFTRVLNPPGAFNTIVTDINDAGELVGWYYDKNGTMHAFAASGIQAVPEPSSLVLVVAGVIGLAASLRRRERSSRTGS